MGSGLFSAMGLLSCAHYEGRWPSHVASKMSGLLVASHAMRCAEARPPIGDDLIVFFDNFLFFE